MHINHDPEQTRHLPTRLKLILAVPVAVLIIGLLILAFGGMMDPAHSIW